MGLLVRGNPVTPGAPGTVTCVATGVSQSTISVDGTGSAPAGWRSWEIFESPTSGGTFVSIATGIPPQAMPYQRTGLGPGVTRWYKVRGTTNDGQFTAQSAEDSGTTSSTSVFSFAPGFPRTALATVGVPVSQYNTSTYKNFLKKVHLAVFTHYSGQQIVMGATMRDIMAEIKSGKDAAMTVTPIHFIYIVNNECFNTNDDATARERNWLNTHRGWLYLNGSSGTPIVSTFTNDLWLVNNTDFGPVDSSGDNFIKYLLKIKKQQNVDGEPGNAPNDQVDAFSLDNVFYKFRRDADYNRDGITDDQWNPTSQLWQRQGLRAHFDYQDVIWPGRLKFGNIADWPDGQTIPAEIAPINGVLHGGVMEALSGESYSIDSWGGFTEMMRWYRFMEDACLDPKLCVFDASVPTSTSYREARRLLAAAAIGGNGYAAVRARDNALAWWDELDNAGAGIEWLGAATEARRSSGSVGTGNVVWRRTFTNGHVYVNPTSSDVTVTASRNLRRINGTQEPAVNSGATIASGATFTVRANDGLFLVNN
jgi:hypothetical protein